MTRSVLASTVLTVLLAVGATLVGPGTAAAVGEGCTPDDGWMMAMPNNDLEAGDTAPQPIEWWCTQGPDTKGVDRAQGWAYQGENNAYIEAWSTSQWNEISQNVVVPNQRTIELSAYVATSSNIQWSYIGVRDKATGAEYARHWIGAVGGRQPDGSVQYVRTSVLFRPNQPVPAGAVTHYTAYIGYITPGGYSEMMVDYFNPSIVG
jgi:hypothetical protein